MFLSIFDDAPEAVVEGCRHSNVLIKEFQKKILIKEFLAIFQKAFGLVFLRYFLNNIYSN